MTRWWVIVAAGLAVFMASVDPSITNVALPTLGYVFVVPPSALEWVVLAYSLPAVALLLPLGRWVDTVALRGAFLLAVCGFAGASVLCGLALSLPWLVMGGLLLASLRCNLGFALGPALATIVWSVSGSGLSGIRAGLLLLMALTVCGVFVIASVRSVPHRNIA